MSAVEDLQSVFSVDKPRSSGERRRSSFGAEASRPAAPSISAERQWLNSVLTPSTEKRAPVPDVYSADLIPLQPQTPSQLAAQQRLQNMQTEINEIIGVMRMNFDTCVKPDKRLSELYHLGPDYNPEWKCPNKDKADEEAAKRRRKLVKQFCIFLAFLLLVILIIVGDYAMSKWFIQKEIEQEVAEGILDKQKMNMTTTTTTAPPPPRWSDAPPSSSSTATDLPLNSVSSLTNPSTSTTQATLPSPPEKSIVITEQEDKGFETTDEVTSDKNIITRELDRLLPVQEGDKFPRAHDVLDEAEVVESPISNSDAAQDVLQRPPAEEDLVMDSVAVDDALEEVSEYSKLEDNYNSYYDNSKNYYDIAKKSDKIQ